VAGICPWGTCRRATECSAAARSSSVASGDGASVVKARSARRPSLAGAGTSPAVTPRSRRSVPSGSLTSAVTSCGKREIASTAQPRPKPQRAHHRSSAARPGPGQGRPAAEPRQCRRQRQAHPRCHQRQPVGTMSRNKSAAARTAESTPPPTTARRGRECIATTPGTSNQPIGALIPATPTTIAFPATATNAERGAISNDPPESGLSIVGPAAGSDGRACKPRVGPEKPRDGPPRLHARVRGCELHGLDLLTPPQASSTHHC